MFLSCVIHVSFMCHSCFFHVSFMFHSCFFHSSFISPSVSFSFLSFIFCHFLSLFLLLLFSGAQNPFFCLDCFTISYLKLLCKKSIFWTVSGGTSSGPLFLSCLFFSFFHFRFLFQFLSMFFFFVFPCFHLLLLYFPFVFI